MRKSLIAVVAAWLGGTPALAADLYVEDPVDPAPVVVGGWYLRGHLGMSNQRLGSMEHELFDVVALHEFVDEGSFDSAPLAGVGIGYQFNEWLRMDGIVEYRGKADFSALDRYDGDGDGVFDNTNDYDGAKSEWLLMANAYVDIGDWYGVKPYVGAGIGASRNTISGFRDINVPMAASPMPMKTRPGTLPGRCMQASPIRRPSVWRSISATATSTSETRRPAISAPTMAVSSTPRCISKTSRRTISSSACATRCND